jgi:hypothetical protein
MCREKYIRERDIAPVDRDRDKVFGDFFLFVSDLLGGDGFDSDWLFFAHSFQDADHHFVTGVELLFDFVQKFWVVVAMEVISNISAIVHKGKVTFFGDIDQVVLDSGYIWDFHVVGGWRHIFVLLTVKDVDTSHVNFGVTVFTSFGGGHIDDLAWMAFEHSISVLSEGTTLDWVGEGTSGSGGFEGFVVRHL